jgi:hypothetical protein
VTAGTAERLGAAAATLSTLDTLAYRDGLAAGLRAILDPALAVPVTPDGYTLLPAGCPALHERAGVTVLPHPLAGREGLVLARFAGWTQHGAARPGDRYALPLAAVRLGLLRRMLDAAVAHLAGRQSDGAPLTGRQLVQASIADAATTLEICGHALAAGSAVERPDTLVAGAWLHARLDRAGLAVAGLFGASGYLRDHPVRCLHLGALVREAWAPGIPGDYGWEC